MIKKSIINTLISRELVTLIDICEMFEKEHIVPIPPKGYISESDVYGWYEADPTLDEKKRILEKLGYDKKELQNLS